MKKWLIKTSVQVTLGTLAFFARRPSFNRVTQSLTSAMARYAIKSKRITGATTPEELGRQWQRAFPSTKQVPIEAIEGGTVYARILTPCPLRGSGDVQTCYRMMAFDREVVERAGGQFVVLESQAQPGVQSCRVAMRLQGAPMTDLIPAHEIL